MKCSYCGKVTEGAKVYVCAYCGRPLVYRYNPRRAQLLFGQVWFWAWAAIASIYALLLIFSLVANDWIGLAQREPGLGFVGRPGTVLTATILDLLSIVAYFAVAGLAIRCALAMLPGAAHRERTRQLCQRLTLIVGPVLFLLGVLGNVVASAGFIQPLLIGILFGPVLFGVGSWLMRRTDDVPDVTSLVPMSASRRRARRYFTWAAVVVGVYSLLMVLSLIASDRIGTTIRQPDLAFVGRPGTILITTILDVLSIVAYLAVAAICVWIARSVLSDAETQAKLITLCRRLALIVGPVLFLLGFQGDIVASASFIQPLLIAVLFGPVLFGLGSWLLGRMERISLTASFARPT